MSACTQGDHLSPPALCLCLPGVDPLHRARPKQRAGWCIPADMNGALRRRRRGSRHKRFNKWDRSRRVRSRTSFASFNAQNTSRRPRCVQAWPALDAAMKSSCGRIVVVNATEYTRPRLAPLFVCTVSQSPGGISGVYWARYTRSASSMNWRAAVTFVQDGTDMPARHRSQSSRNGRDRPVPTKLCFGPDTRSWRMMKIAWNPAPQLSGYPRAGVVCDGCRSWFNSTGK